MKPEVSRTLLEAPGPWVHRRVSASGASFHVADAGPEDSSFAVILLHSFPMTWWTWREVIPAFTEAGIRTISMDIRGFGTSDLTPGEVELTQLASDVAAVASALGISSYTVVGNGMGGVIAWLDCSRVCSPPPGCALPSWAFFTRPRPLVLNPALAPAAPDFLRVKVSVGGSFDFAVGSAFHAGPHAFAGGCVS